MSRIDDYCAAACRGDAEMLLVIATSDGRLTPDEIDWAHMVADRSPCYHVLLWREEQRTKAEAAAVGEYVQTLRWQNFHRIAQERLR